MGETLMTATVFVSIALSLGLIIGGFALGGRYTIAAGPSATYVLDRFTGSAYYCYLGECAAVKMTP
jgi:hypothetical protein